MGCGGGQMISVLAFNSNDPSSNPAESTVFICKVVWKGAWVNISMIIAVSPCKLSNISHL